MMFSYSKILLFFAIMTGMSACGGSAQLTDTSTVTEREYTQAEVASELKGHNINFEWFTAKAKVKIASPDENVNGLLFVRAQRDSMIWLLFKKNSVEASRVLIRPDSFFIIFRLEQKYRKGTIAELEQELQINFSFDDVQQWMVGNAILPSEESLIMEKLESTYRLQGRDAQLSLQYWLSGSPLQLDKAMYTDQKGRSITMKYTGYKDVRDKGKIPYIREYNVPLEDGQEAYFKLEFNEIGFEKTNKPPFSIPTHYQEVN